MIFHTVWTVGYTDQNPANLKAFAETVGAVVVDIRYSPRSRHPAWSQAALKRLLGDSYFHLREFGNVNYKSGGIKLHDSVGGLAKAEAMLQEFPIVLMCVCRDYRHCHRLVCARLLSGRGYPVQHIVNLGMALEEWEDVDGT